MQKRKHLINVQFYSTTQDAEVWIVALDQLYLKYFLIYDVELVDALLVDPEFSLLKKKDKHQLSQQKLWCSLAPFQMFRSCRYTCPSAYGYCGDHRNPPSGNHRIGDSGTVSNLLDVYIDLQITLRKR